MSNDASTAPTSTALTTIALADGQVRVWEKDAAANDLGHMYVLDVFGVSILIRQREDGMFVHIDQNAESDPPEDSGPLIIEVANGGETTYGEEELDALDQGVDHRPSATSTGGVTRQIHGALAGTLMSLDIDDVEVEDVILIGGAEPV